MEFRENQLDVKTYLALRQSVSWKPLSQEQAQHALEHSLYVLTAWECGKAVGMGRIVGDGAVICYVQDLIVCPGYQGEGLGGALLERLIAYVERLRLPGTEMMLDLMCARGREEFYQRHRFTARPTRTLGPGMIQYLTDS